MKTSKLVTRGLALTALLASGSAFAWKDHNDSGPAGPSQNRDVVDTDASQASREQGKLIVRLDVADKKSYVQICDYIARATFTNGDDELTESAYLDRKLLRARRTFEVRFAFYTQDQPEGYYPLKDSLRVDGACLELEGPEQQNPSQVPDPHTSCDPEYKDCGQTCKGDVPDQSGSPEQASCKDPYHPW